MKTCYYIGTILFISWCTYLIMDFVNVRFVKLEKQIQSINIHIESKDSIHFACVLCGWPNRLATADTTRIRENNLHTMRKHSSHK